jgi:glyoxylase-like metal-dependent hydrolase (beta-lactamase superfamily II)
MLIDRTGEVVPGFHVVGHTAQQIYLLDGPAPALFDSGYTAMAYVFEQAVKEVLGDRAPAYLFLTHSHFDHIGSASHLKKVWPEMRIAASAGVQDVLARPNAVKVIRELNVAAAGNVRQRGMAGAPGLFNEEPFEPFAVDLVVGDGQKIRLSDGLTLEALASPGHTRDMLSYYVPERKILVGTEAVGIQDPTGSITTDFLVGFDVFWDSLARLSRLDVDILCQGHGLVFTGEDAKSRLTRAQKSAERFVANVEQLLLQEKGNLENVVARVKADEFDRRPDSDMKLPEPAYLLNLQAKVKAIWARMEKQSRGA